MHHLQRPQLLAVPVVICVVGFSQFQIPAGTADIIELHLSGKCERDAAFQLGLPVQTSQVQFSVVCPAHVELAVCVAVLERPEMVTIHALAVDVHAPVLGLRAGIANRLTVNLAVVLLVLLQIEQNRVLISLGPVVAWAVSDHPQLLRDLVEGFLLLRVPDISRRYQLHRHPLLSRPFRL